MTKHYSPTRREQYRDAEARRKLRDQQRRQARKNKRATHTPTGARNTNERN